jgi:hypothetical protein
VLDDGGAALEPFDDRDAIEHAELLALRQAGRGDDAALKVAAFAVVEPGGDGVGAHLVQGAVGQRGDDLVERQARGDGFAHLVERERLTQPQILRGEPALLEPALHDVHDLLDLERLQDVVVRPALHGVDRGLDRAEAGHDHGQRVGVDLGDLSQQIEAAHTRHLEVADDQVVARAFELLHGARAVLRRAHDVAFHPEEVRDDVANELFVVDDEDARSVLGEGRVELCHGGGSRGGRAASRSVTSLRAEMPRASPASRAEQPAEPLRRLGVM